MPDTAPTPPSSFLARAVADAREDANRRAADHPLSAVKETAAVAPPPRGFHAALSKPGMALIAEVKRRSPSRGEIRADLNPATLAQAYQRGGAAAISVLTEPHHFSGSPGDLGVVHTVTALPVLRKDFITTAYQVWEARAWGADAVLLIVAALDPGQLVALLAEAAEAGLDALVEVHTRAEAKTAAAAGATLIGINARDLATLTVDPDRFAAVRAALPARNGTGGVTVVAESGIHDRAGVLALAGAGADAVLVGESLVRAYDPAAAAAALLGLTITATPESPIGGRDA